MNLFLTVRLGVPRKHAEVPRKHLHLSALRSPRSPANEKERGKDETEPPAEPAPLNTAGGAMLRGQVTAIVGRIRRADRFSTRSLSAPRRAVIRHLARGCHRRRVARPAACGSLIVDSRRAANPPYAHRQASAGGVYFALRDIGANLFQRSRSGARQRSPIHWEGNAKGNLNGKAQHQRPGSGCPGRT